VLRVGCRSAGHALHVQGTAHAVPVLSLLPEVAVVVFGGGGDAWPGLLLHERHCKQYEGQVELALKRPWLLF